MRIHTLFLLTAALAAGCAGDADECENSLALGIDDDGSEQLIDDGCTSLIVNMPLSDTATWDSPADLDESILRFDYASDAEDDTFLFGTSFGFGLQFDLGSLEDVRLDYAYTSVDHFDGLNTFTFQLGF